MSRQAQWIRYIPIALVIALSAGLLRASPATEAFEANDYTRAEALLRAELANEADAGKQVMLGIIAMSRAEFEPAYAIFEKAIAIDSNNADAHYWLGASAGSLAGNASLFKAAGWAKKTRRAFERAIELDQTHVPAHQGLVQYYLQAPGFLGGDKDKAKTLAAKLALFSPTEGRLLQAQIHAQLKEPEQQRAILTELIGEQPDDPRAYLQLGFLDQGDEEFSEAINAFRRAVATDGDGEEADNARQAARYQIGRSAVFSGEQAALGIDALTDYLAGEMYPGNPGAGWATYRRGQLYQIAGEQEKAAEDFATAETLEDDPRLREAIRRATR